MSESRLLDAYIDETHLDINGRPCLIYAALVPHGIEEAIAAVSDLRLQHGLDHTFEVKWSSKHPDAALKARLKEHLIGVLSHSFSCLFSVTASSDKDEAFLQLLEQIRALAVSDQKQYVNLYYDQDVFRTRARIQSVLRGWASPQCTTLASLDSSFSIPIQLADLAAGAFRYITLAAFGSVTPKTVVVTDYDGSNEQWALDQLFHVMLRHSIPGSTPPIDPDAPEIPFEAFMKDCFGQGIVVDPRFTEAEQAIFKRESSFYIGCMH